MIAKKCDENLTARLYQEYSAKIHKQKLKKIKSRNLSMSLSYDPQPIPAHKGQSFEKVMKMKEVERENKILFDKLTEISERKKQEEKKEQRCPKTLNFINRKKYTEQIIVQNNSFIRRLIEKPSQISIKQLKMDYEASQKYKENLSKRKILDRIERIVKFHPIIGMNSVKSKQEISLESRKNRMSESDVDVSN